MDEDIVDIRKVSDLFGVSQRALRFYEAKQLLHPTRKGRIRQFSRRDIARLKFILRGKACGFSLDEIRHLLDLYDAEDGPEQQKQQMLKLAKVRRSELLAQSEALQATLENVQLLADELGDIESSSSQQRLDESSVAASLGS